MLPLLRAGDQVMVTPVNRPLRRGDLVVFAQGDQLLIHRLIGFEESNGACYLITKGDNGASDPPVPLAQVVGIVVVLQRATMAISLAAPQWKFLGWLLAVTAAFPPVHNFLLRTGKRMAP